MTDATIVDDRRRFRELWKELAARTIAALLAGAAVLLLHDAAIHLVVEYYGSRLGPLMWKDIEALRSTLGFVVPCILIATMSPVYALPSVVVKQGRTVFPVVALFVAAGLTVGTLAGVYGRATLPGSLLGVVGAALGLAEGMLERSTATIYSGLMGGAFMGALLGAGHRAYLDSLAGQAATFAPRLLASCLLLAGLHLSIGLSLALGRWIRDLPKREQEQSQPTE